MTVIIGIDPHKRSHTAVALGIDDEVLGELRVAADTRQVSKLIRFAKGLAGPDLGGGERQRSRAAPGPPARRDG